MVGKISYLKISISISLMLIFFGGANYNLLCQELMYGNAGLGMDLNLKFPVEFLNMQFMNISNNHYGFGFIVGYAYASIDIKEDFEAAYSLFPLSFSWVLFNEGENLYSNLDNKFVDRFGLIYLSVVGSAWGKADFTDQKKKEMNFIDFFVAANIPVTGDINFESRIGNIFSNIPQFSGFYFRVFLNFGFVQKLN